MTAAAELRCAVAGSVVARIVPAADEEVRRFDSRRTRVEVRHVVLIVTSRAGDPRWATRDLDQGADRSILGHVKIVGEEELAFWTEGDATVRIVGAIPVIGSAA